MCIGKPHERVRDAVPLAVPDAPPALKPGAENLSRGTRRRLVRSYGQRGLGRDACESLHAPIGGSGPFFKLLPFFFLFSPHTMFFRAPRAPQTTTCPPPVPSKNSILQEEARARIRTGVAEMGGPPPGMTGTVAVWELFAPSGLYAGEGRGDLASYDRPLASMPKAETMGSAEPGFSIV